MLSSLFFPKKLKERVHYIDKLEDIYEVIDQDLLLLEHGGKLDFDSEAWVTKQIQREESGKMASIMV